MGVGAVVKAGLGRFFPRAVMVRGARGSEPRTAVTFDDGPHPEHTPRILDALDAANAKATFFVQGAELERRPDLVRDMVRRGHQVGNHGYSHFHAFVTPRDVYVADIERAHVALEQAIGAPVEREFRPPHGSVTPGTFLELVRRGYRFVFWSADSRDSFIRTPEGMLAHVAQLGVRDGDIVLLHEDYAHTVDSLPRLLAHLRERRLRCATIAELAA